MSLENEIEERLARLGRRMTPDADFVPRVMRQIESPVQRPRQDGARGWWSIIGWSLAASVLLSIGGVVLIHNRPPIPGAAHQSGALTAADSSDADSTAQFERSAVRWQTVTERAVTLDGEVPAREVRQQEFERLRWVDPDHHATFERVVPRQGATFFTMESY